VITDAGYAAVGCTRPQAAPPADPALDAAVKTAEATWQGDGQPREKSKQAQVIAMLKRPEGATIAQICETTGWQAHTVRGTFAGAFKKKLKLDITSTKEAGADRVYMISEGADGRFRLMWQINIPTALFAGQWFDYGLTVLRLADDEQQGYTFIAPRQLIKVRFYESAVEAMHAAIDALPK
jgi:hypothetical protein